MHVQVYNFNVPTFGPGVVYDVDQKVRTEQFRFFTEVRLQELIQFGSAQCTCIMLRYLVPDFYFNSPQALKKDRLKKYVPQFVMEAEVWRGQKYQIYLL